VHLHYTDRHRLPASVEKELNLTWHPNPQSMVKVCDVVTINCPLHPETEHLFNAKLLSTMKRGAYIVNTARGKICDRDAIVDALKSGQLAGYAGDVFFPQPAPKFVFFFLGCLFVHVYVTNKFKTQTGITLGAICPTT